MLAFKKKNIQNQNSIGYILKDARSKTGLSLKLVAKHTKINAKYLAALEKDDWQKLPGEIYAKNFLSQYCQFLEINPNDLKVDFNKIPHFENMRYHNHEFRKKTHKKLFLNLPNFFKIAIIAILSLLFLVYITWQLNQIIKPPEIILYHPVADLTTHTDSIIISGQTEPEVKIKINNQDVLLDENYNFQQQLNLSPGLNTIKIEGKGKYSKTRVIERKIILE